MRRQSSEELRSDWKENFKLYAKALNKVDEGNKVLADYDKHIHEAQKELGDKLNSKISMVRFMPGMCVCIRRIHSQEIY